MIMRHVKDPLRACLVWVLSAKLKSSVRFHIDRPQVSPSGEENGRQNYLLRLASACMVPHQNEIPGSGGKLNRLTTLQKFLTNQRVQGRLKTWSNWAQGLILETNPKKPNSCPRTYHRSSKDYDTSRDKYINVVAKRNRRSTSSRRAPIVEAAIDKTISATTVHRRVHLNHLCPRVPRARVPLSIQRCTIKVVPPARELDEWGNVMFTDESAFVL
ncbi:HTH_Tnp_Tc3_2 domain-containing protein [Trichonephila clavipes]|uniref:HTH_Tnp_Tc3_2 domain-containing protein n=1 Tax=Trichonephila clavipes TaxID=2585209 RepID=A0A8X6R611_TRICX|nr:HTH_Tnp_Tc3_2 domain-containing protein [Trichonephila clavipes]